MVGGGGLPVHPIVHGVLATLDTVEEIEARESP